MRKLHTSKRFPHPVMAVQAVFALIETPYHHYLRFEEPLLEEEPAKRSLRRIRFEQWRILRYWIMTNVGSTFDTSTSPFTTKPYRQMQCFAQELSQLLRMAVAVCSVAETRQYQEKSKLLSHIGDSYFGANPYMFWTHIMQQVFLDRLTIYDTPSNLVEITNLRRSASKKWQVNVDNGDFDSISSGSYLICSDAYENLVQACLLLSYGRFLPEQSAKRFRQEYWEPFLAAYKAHTTYIRYGIDSLHPGLFFSKGSVILAKRGKEQVRVKFKGYYELAQPKRLIP